MKGRSPTGSVLLLLLLLNLHPGEGLPLQPVATCCTQLYRQPLSAKLLRKVVRVEMQKVDGNCHLQAFVLHLTHRTVCIHPKNRSLARWFERRGKRLQGTPTTLKLGLKGKKIQGAPKPKQ